MAFFDLPLEELKQYRPERNEPADFDAFWKSTLDESRAFPLDPLFEPVDTPLKTVEVYDVTYSGYMGQRIRGWFLLPRHIEGKLPCVVRYIGYTGGRGEPVDHLQYVAAGYAMLVMDSRGQGGVTPDPMPPESGPSVENFMTKGIMDPATYYYRRIITDAVRAVDAARAHERVDPEHIAAAGGSQGGGLTIASAALADNVELALPDVPFLCGYHRATSISDAYPYREIADYCQRHPSHIDQVFKTLSYFDGINLVTRAKAAALFSVGLMDMTCPPSTVFAAYNYYAGPKDIRIYPYNGHEGGQSAQLAEGIKFLASHWG